MNIEQFLLFNISLWKFKLYINKAVLETRVWPAFAIKYFYNHFSFSPTPMVHMKECGWNDTIFQNLSKRSITPRWPLTPLLLRSHVWLCLRIILSKFHENNYVKVCGYSDLFFFKNLNQRSWTPRWPLTPSLLRSHVWRYPRILVSKSHGNTSMYVDTAINFAK